jgi:hypothetical protein
MAITATPTRRRTTPNTPGPKGDSCAGMDATCRCASVLILTSGNVDVRNRAD